ncbi:DUF349 domain-containing protein [Flavobacterium xueshanense]|uniref:DUF349 domain-containing protein n=1 Tax=Flavobacterium xueshanense TaxID=935223 RepID=A0A1I2IQ60_9FLAO|nr:DUF349 domain-containing protein [Flavobacterium xueshanense]SFF44542.1 protein of unknown function [Flavobacterium xueshanense]
MLEEKNDNLLEADGNVENNSVDGTNAAAKVLESNEPSDFPAEDNVVTPSLEETVSETKNQTAIDAIAETNAEESEDETLKERHDIPMKDYDALSLEDLVEELKALISNEKAMSFKDHIEEIKKAFLAKYNHLLEEKKEEFLTENQDPNEEFQYHSPLKTNFDKYYSHFRDTKNNHFKSLQTNLKTNLENRLAIVEELKELINPQANIKDTLKHFNDLRERWKNAGSIPKDKYNHVWNNFHFHVENFYDYLHLDREARDLDFKHNLEQKQKIVSRVEELVKEADINKAFRELQDLHRIWKEDIGPVSREHRDDIWNKFSDLTKQMHDKREVLFENQRGTELENLEKKKEIIAKIEVLATEKVNAHAQWMAQIEKVEALRTAFFSAGKVPSEVNEETWASFKTAVRNFNSFKNSFYKDIKKDQNDNLSMKAALVAKAKELQESTDFAAATPIMKQIQEEWKQIGHVPRKHSDKIWQEFKNACNHYFDKLKEQKNEENGEEVEAFDNKKAYLETLREFQLTGDHKTDLDAIKLHIETWKGFGKVPFPRRHIEGKFNKILDALFEKLSLSKKDTDMIRFANRMDQLSESHDSRKLDSEKIFIMRKIDEVQNEIFQLENNIQFFTNTRNAKKENSIVLEVRKNIAIHKETLDVWKEKLKQLRNLKIE